MHALAEHLGRVAALVERMAEDAARAGHLCRDVPPGDRPNRVDLLGRFLSDTERTILRAVAHLAPCRAAAVFDSVRSKVTRATFFVLWSNLQIRSLVEQDDDGEYRLAAEWIADLVNQPVR